MKGDIYLLVVGVEYGWAALVVVWVVMQVHVAFGGEMHRGVGIHVARVMQLDAVRVVQNVNNGLCIERHECRGPYRQGTRTRYLALKLANEKNGLNPTVPRG